MSTNRNHTHTGNCQACGREHAVDIIKGDIAKHGYTVDWGSFNGVCDGADRLPAQKDVSYTHVVIARCNDIAKHLDARALRLEARTEDPITCTHYDPQAKRTDSRGFERTGCNIEIPYGAGTKDEQHRARVALISQCKHMAEGNRSHAAMLTEFVLPLFGTELTSVEQAEVRRAAERRAREAKPTKAEFKRQLETQSRAYDRARDRIQKELLQIRGADEDSAEWKAAYYALPFSLCHYRVKHGQAVLKVLPGVASLIAECELLFDRYSDIKAAQKQAGL